MPVRARPSWADRSQRNGHGANSQAKRGIGFCAALAAGSSRRGAPPVGIVGLWYPEGFPERELGWDLFDGATGKGYATEAAQAARAYAYDTLGWDTLISLVADGNDASAAVCARLGAKTDGTFDHAVFGRTTIWRHPSPAEIAA